MKKTLITILISIWSVMLFSQDYYPLIEENKQWSVLCEGFHFPWEPPYYTTEIFKIMGDTIIDNLIFDKLYHSSDEFPTNWDLIYLIKEDTNKRIWFREIADEIEYLMYDFSLSQGDSIQVGCYEPVYLHVDSISSVMVNSTLRKHYWMSFSGNPDYHETWIEGLGSDKGIIYSGSALLVGGWVYLLCVHKDDDLIYINPNFDDCYIITNIHEINRKSIQVYPNPVKNILTIINPNRIKFKSISMIGLVGQKIQFDPKSSLLDISFLPAGLYLLKLSFDNDEMILKIVVE